jgi:two-component system NtrC family sensor kinase
MAVVWTIEEHCKQCYACIRECPAKAIKVEKGQAKVLEHRCIGCGHCVRVCSQGAKAVLSGVTTTLRLLTQNKTVVAMLAPSFPAAFPDMAPEMLVGALRECGFSRVVEAAFGADLINRAYVQLLKDEAPFVVKKPVITTSCPAIIHYVQKYAPELIDNLAPIVSPMIAMGRVAKKFYSDEAKVVFIGPCTAKKLEIKDEEVSDAVDEVLTFKELEELFDKVKVVPQKSQASWFDPPHPILGRIYPITGGMLRSSGLPFDIMDNEIIQTEGKHSIMRLLDCVRNREIQASLLDMLFCEGCINGPFINHSVNYFTRKQKIVQYTEARQERTSHSEWAKYIEKCQYVKITRQFKPRNILCLLPTEEEIQGIFAQINKFSSSDELNCGACGYESCRDYATAFYQNLAEEEMCLPYLIDKLQKTQTELQNSLKELAETQEQLIQHEKLASVGQLAAGVAHEVNNPLGSIMLFAHLLLQQTPGSDQRVSDIKFIMDEARRCKKIVSGLLDFARQGQLNLRDCHISEIVDKMNSAVNKQPLFHNVQLDLDIDADIPEMRVDSDQIYQVFLNLAVNAAEAMPNGGRLAITAKADLINHRVRVTFADEGVGIPPENLNKLFTPFFTTKQIGKGTGLGLAIAYGIIKMHKGNILIKSAPGEGTTFTVELPLQMQPFLQEAIMN